MALEALTSADMSAAVTDRLAKESIGWLTTVGPTGVPAPTPVWFLWTGTQFLIFSQPKTAKLAHIAHSPAVALNLNSSTSGNSVAVFNGKAYVDDAGAGEEEWSSYLAKYREDIDGLGMTPEEFSTDYSVLIRIIPKRLRAW